MGTIVNRNGRHRVVIRRKDVAKPITKTFDTAKEANAWMVAEENRLNHRTVDASGMTLGDILNKYITDIIRRASYKIAEHHHRRFAIQFSHTDLNDMSKEWWLEAAASWQKISPATRLKYLIVIKSAMQAAVDLWKVKYDWTQYQEAMQIMTRQKLIGPARARTQRVTPEEIAHIKGALNSYNQAAPMADIIDFALCTAMRRGEIMELKWSDLDDSKRAPMIWVRNRKDPRKKDGNDDHVPLLGDALKIIQRQPRMPGEPRIFPYIGQSISVNFRHLSRSAGIKNLHFHDLRHEAISRLFELGYGIVEVALVSGHKNWKTLQKYTHIKPQSLHEGPLAHRRAA